MENLDPQEQNHRCSLRLSSCREIRLPSCSGGSAGLPTVLIIWGMLSEFLSASSWEQKTHSDYLHSAEGPAGAALLIVMKSSLNH